MNIFISQLQKIHLTTIKNGFQRRFQTVFIANVVENKHHQRRFQKNRHRKIDVSKTVN